MQTLKLEREVKSFRKEMLRKTNEVQDCQGLRKASAKLEQHQRESLLTGSLQIRTKS